MRSAEEAAVAQHGVVASVDFIQCRQFDLGSGVRDRCKTIQADRIVRTVSIETMRELAERAGDRAASFPVEAQA
jgi:hypothetical protein